MKAERCELKKSEGEIRLLPETLDDLWHLSHLIGEGDLVFALTFRSMEQASDKIRPEKAEKKPVRLGVRVEKVEFNQSADRLRISGSIEVGVDLTSHHTLNIEPGIEVSVIKHWRDLDLERIDRAVAATGTGAVHLVAIEEGEAQIFRIRQSGPELVCEITVGSGKGAETGTRIDLFVRCKDILGDVTGDIVIAGPGFVKDEFVAYLRDQAPDTAEVVTVFETRRTGRGAVQDVIGGGLLERLAGDAHLAREVRLMDEVLARIATGGAVAYGVDEVGKAVAYGAVETILVTDTSLRDMRITAILDQAELRRAAVIVFSTAFEPGERLDALGGIAAVLRYRV